MKVLYLVNAADAQSVPLELGLRLAEADPGITVAALYDASDHPPRAGRVVRLGARGAMDGRAIRRLAQLVRATSPDIVHVHHTASALWGAMFGSVAAARIVKTEHNDHRHLPLKPRLGTLMVAPVLSAVIANSHTTAGSFGRALSRLARAKTTVIYNGVDLAEIRAARPAARADGVPVIGTVGRLVPQKNHARLLEALGLALGQTNLRLEIAGAGPEAARLAALAAQLGVTEQVRLLGGLTRDQTYAQLATWEGFIMPSRFEGFCNALVEARAAGLPLAYSNIDTLREVMGNAGLTFSPEDPTEMAAALIALAAGTAPAIPGAEVFDIDVAVDAHLALYARLLRAPEARSLVT